MKYVPHAILPHHSVQTPGDTLFFDTDFPP